MALIAALRESRNALRVIVFIGLFCGSNGVAFGFTTWPILLKTLLTKNAHVGWISAMVSFMQIAASVLAGLGLTSYTTTLHTAAAMLLASTAVITTAIYTESLTLLLAGALCNGAATGGLFPAVETIFARSVSDKHRSVLYGAKLSADLGCGILGIALSGVAFHVMGNEWTLPIVRTVMLGSMAVMGAAAVLLFTVSEKYTVLSDGSRVPESAHAVSLRHDGSIGSYATWTPAAASRVGMYGSTSMSMSPGSMTPGRYTMSNGASGRSGRAFSISARHSTQLHRRALSDDGMDVTESAAFSRVGLLSSSISVASHRQQRSNPHGMTSPRISGDQGSPVPSSCQSRHGRTHAVGLQCLTAFGRSHSAQSHSHSSAAQQRQANTPRDNDHTHQQVRRFWSPGAAPGTFVPGAAFVHDEESAVNAWSHFERRRSSSQRRQSTASTAPSDLTIGSYNSMARRATLVPEQMGGRHLHDDDSDRPGALSVSSGKTSSNSSGHFSFGDETQAAASPKFLPRPDVSKAVVATDSSAEQDATLQDAVVEATNAAEWKGSPALRPGLCSLPTMAPLPLGSVNPDTPMLRQDTRIPEFSTLNVPPAQEMSTTAVNHDTHLTSTKSNNDQPSLIVAENDTSGSIRLPQKDEPTMTTNGAVAGDASNHTAPGTANGAASLSYGTMASGPTKENPLTHHGGAVDGSAHDVLKDSDNLQMTVDLISASMSPPWQALSSTCSSISTASILPFTVQRLSYVAAPDSFTISSRFDKSDGKANHTNDPRQDDVEARAESSAPADSVRVRRPSHVTFASLSAKRHSRENVPAQTDVIAGDASMSWAIHSMPLDDPTGLQETFHLGRRNTMQPSDFRQHKFTANDGAAQPDEENARAENADNNDDKNDNENNDDEVDMVGDGEGEQAVPGHSESAPLLNTTHAPAPHAMYMEDNEDTTHQVPGSRANENDHHHCAFFSQTVSGRSVLLSPSHAHGGHHHHHHDCHSHSNSADRRSGAGVSQHQSRHRSSTHGLLDIQQFFNPSRRWSSMRFSSNPIAHPPPGSKSNATAAPRPTESTALLRDYMHGNDGGEIFSRSQTRSPNIPPTNPQQPAPYQRNDAKSDTSESEGSTVASEPQSMTMMQHVLAAQGLMLMLMTVGQGSVQPYVSVFASEAAEITPVALIIAEVVARVAALLLAQMVAVLSHCGISRPSMSAPVALVTAGSALTLAGAAAIASPSSSTIRSAASLLGSSVSTSAGKSAAASVSSPLLVSSVLAASVGRHAGATAGGSLSRSMMADCMVVEDRGRWNIRAAGAYAMSAAAAIVGGVLCDHVGYAAAFCAAFALHAVTLLLSMAAFRTQDPAAVPTADVDAGAHDDKHRGK